MSAFSQPIMILAGGTGGHVFPALAVADELRARGVPIVWVGTARGIESRVVPAAGIELVEIAVRGVRNKGGLSKLLALGSLLKAMLQAFKIIRAYRPCSILGMGGFVSGPCGLMGALLRKPLIVHEQNSVMGLTNRLLAPLSRQMFSGFPITHRLKKITCCGNPVRQSLLDVPAPAQRLASRTEKIRILVIGGSQGANALNRIVPEALSQIQDPERYEVCHQSGRDKEAETLSAYSKVKSASNIQAFVEDMQAAYSWADLVICRSGAITLAEVASVGVATILVPYPHAVDDHQTANARVFEQAGAACLVSESELNADRLAKLIEQISSDRSVLVKMAEQAKTLAEQNATIVIADALMQACKYDNTLDHKEAA